MPTETDVVLSSNPGSPASGFRTSSKCQRYGGGEGDLGPDLIKIRDSQKVFGDKLKESCFSVRLPVFRPECIDQKPADGSLVPFPDVRARIWSRRFIAPPREKSRVFSLRADGTFEMQMKTKAEVRHDGKVKWRPPTTFKSSCDIDVKFFPFDEQSCSLAFGSWTYNIEEVRSSHAA